MNHPDLLLINAQLYHAKKMQEAEAHRQVQKVLENKQTFWGALVHKIQMFKNAQKHLNESTLLENIRYASIQETKK